MAADGAAVPPPILISSRRERVRQRRAAAAVAAAAASLATAAARPVRVAMPLPSCLSRLRTLLPLLLLAVVLVLAGASSPAQAAAEAAAAASSRQAGTAAGQAGTFSRRATHGSRTLLQVPSADVLAVKLVGNSSGTQDAASGGGGDSGGGDSGAAAAAPPPPLPPPPQPPPPPPPPDLSSGQSPSTLSEPPFVINPDPGAPIALDPQTSETTGEVARDVGNVISDLATGIGRAIGTIAGDAGGGSAGTDTGGGGGGGSDEATAKPNVSFGFGISNASSPMTTNPVSGVGAPPDVVAAGGPDGAVLAPTVDGGGPMPADQDNRGANSIVAAAGPDVGGFGGGGGRSVRSGSSRGGGGGGGASATAGSDNELQGTDGWFCDWQRGHADCAKGYSCIPSDRNNAAEQGTCMANPVGGNPIPPDLAAPVVFYPLTNGSLSAWPPGSGSAYDGLIVQGNVYAEDVNSSDADTQELFPGAITCDQAESRRSASSALFPGGWEASHVRTLSRVKAPSRDLAFTELETRITTPLQPRPDPALGPYWWYATQAPPSTTGTMKWNGSSSLIAIPGITYGRTGAFTINFWMRKRAEDTAPGPSDGSTEYGNNSDSSNDGSNSSRGAWQPPVYEYMLTHANLQPLSVQASRYTAMDRNQIAVYLAPRTSPLYGIARAYVKDSNDGRGVVYLDSDGQVADNDQTRLQYRWDQVAVQVGPGCSTGYDPSRVWNASARAEIDGGDPLTLGGPLLLCGRYGGPYSRAYGGQLANLAVFDAVLDATDVATLYDMVRDQDAVPSPVLPIRRHPWYGSTLLTPPEWLTADESDSRLANEYGTLTGSPPSATTPPLPPAPPPFAEAATAPGGAASPDTSSSSAATAAATNASRSAFAEALTEALVAALTGVSYKRNAGMPCSLDLRREAGLAFCDSGLVCAAIPSRIRTDPMDAWMRVTGGSGSSSRSGNGNGSNTTTRIYTPAAAAAAIDAAASATALLGICTPPASGMLLPSSWPADWPAPAAHFPLTRGSLRSWPAGAYGGRLVNATWGPDARFGQVIQCDRASRSRVVLDAVPYGTRGPMAINLWVRTSREDLTPQGADSAGLQYVFSHIAGGTFKSFGPNQIHMFIPEVGSPLYGVSVRGMLRDGDDVNLGRTSEVYLDSDGAVGNDRPKRWVHPHSSP
ncbi:hypothetical protein VOLCADRAFT_95156 [Volvox carteri f. nagariensis]|uniref:Uncharacterized protein n=1 Tax=Volvox carteri f. nagariensis TaxID=3068 RepID=D8U6R6_VOLCA|nr:uncharacterized protein VOLCADRAFT_95156 [Volvox carteri f. nagariensis]EFJ44556.1 hypothetical protein VOLCADRAFT_95156 [Volvox carteri f. nagariensis]|eukprot:XP_002954406.1 hypothetical protein VOLCADRAFT_95156 [Volvox carteri f. nagariensis]